MGDHPAPAPAPAPEKWVAALSSKSLYDRTTALSNLLQITQESTEEEDKHLSPILKVENAVELLATSMDSTDPEESGLGLTVATNLAAGEPNGAMLFEDGRLFKHALAVLARTDKETKSAHEQQLRDIAMLCLSNFSVNPLHTTRMAEQGALPPIIKSFITANTGLERHHAVKALCYISQDAIVRDMILPEYTKQSPEADFKSAVNRILKSGGKSDETGNALEILRNLDILRDWVKPGRPIRDVSDFPFCKMLEENYAVIKKEFDALALEHLVAWPERYLCRKGWDVFGLYAFNNRLEENCAKCPETARILSQVPGMTTAMFSCLQPRTHIRPHIGYYQYSNYILRAHLGINVPPGCALKVNGVEQTWDNGKAFVFDDTFRHEAYNKSEQVRVVLMIDFKFEGDPVDRNPAFQQASPTIPGGADEALVSPALMAKLSEFVTPQHVKSQRSPTTSDS